MPKIVHNPYDPEYVLCGCPECSNEYRWTHRSYFHQTDGDDGETFWSCEACGMSFSDEDYQKVLERDGMKQNLDILEWPIKYAWAGGYPHNGGFSYPCPKCGSSRTSYGTIANTTSKVLGTMMRWFCTKCAHIFDLMDVPSFWDSQVDLPMDEVVS